MSPPVSSTQKKCSIQPFTELDEDNSIYASDGIARAGQNKHHCATMPYNYDIHHRCSIRLRDYDYSQAGAYFITICTQNRECLFRNIADEAMRINAAGMMILQTWNELPQRFSNAELDIVSVMPNHLHGIIFLHRRGESCIRPLPSATIGDHKDRPYGTMPDSIGRIVQAFKSISTHQYIQGVKEQEWQPFPGRLWQRNYWERIIRDESELEKTRAYIQNNPAQWAMDELNPFCAQ